MVQREVAERFVARPAHDGVRRGEREGRLLGDGAHRRQRARRRCSCRDPNVESSLVEIDAARAAPTTDPAICSRSCAPGSASVARCCAARSTASSRPSSSRRPASRPPRVPRSSTCSAWCRLADAVATAPAGDAMSTWRAHAKLTMSLRVTGVRDDGYHLIDAEMVSLELHDVLSFEPCDPRRRRADDDRSVRRRGPDRRHEPRRPGARPRRIAPPSRHDRQAHPARRRARWRIGRRGDRAAVGRLRHEPVGIGVPVVSAPTSRSASSAGAPACPGSARSSSLSPTSTAR